MGTKDNKIAAKDIQKGMEIRYVGHDFYTDHFSALCGSIKKNSPTLIVKDVQNDPQKFKHNKGVIVTNTEGIEIIFSTRMKVIVL